MHTRFLQPALRSLAMLALLMAWIAPAAAPAAQAQTLFGVQLSDEGSAAVTSLDAMNAEQLLGVLTEDGRLVYKGERPAMAKQIIIVLTNQGGNKKAHRERAVRARTGRAPGGQTPTRRPVPYTIRGSFPR